MPNERLRDALLRNRLGLDDVARTTNVDAKTVERWLTKGRIPYARHRHAVASLVQETESYLWPEALAPDRRAAIAESEVVKVYPHRHSATADMWTRLLDHSGERVDVLIYSAMFLVDDPTWIDLLRHRADAGVKIRILLGDPASRAVARRGTDEGIGKTTVSAKVRNAIAVYRPLADVDGVEVRCHATTLYCSIYRFDDEMLVNMHVYGFMAGHAPLLHLRRISGGDLFDTYAQSFDLVWDTAKPVGW